MGILYKDLSYRIVGILFEVYNYLGYGYQEKYYQKALELAFQEAGIEFFPQCPYKILYKKEELGVYYIDFVIERRIVLEIKQGRHFSRRQFKQVEGYLKATNLKLGILANFSPDHVKFKRIVNIK